MMAGEQHLGDLAAAPVFRAGVLRVLQQAVPVAFRRESLLVGQHARHHAADRIRDRHGRDLAAGQHEITDGDLLIHALVDKPLVDSLIMTADQNKMLLREQLTRFFLIERAPVRRETPCEHVRRRSAPHGTGKAAPRA